MANDKALCGSDPVDAIAYLRDRLEELLNLLRLDAIKVGDAYRDLRTAEAAQMQAVRDKLGN